MQLEWVENDGTFGAAFSFGTVDEEGVRAIDEASLALVLHIPAELLDATDRSPCESGRCRDDGSYASCLPPRASGAGGARPQ